MNKRNSQKVNENNLKDSKAESHEEGDLYLKSDGEVYTIVYNTECRLCELVWETFNGDIPQGYKVVHIDGDKLNNRLDNLKLENE